MASPLAFFDGNARNVYAERASRRAIADSYYLAHWRKLGHSEAGRRTCERFGHDVRGGRCERCGAGAAQVRDEHLASRARSQRSTS